MHIKHKKGVVLPTILMVFFVLAIIGGASVALSGSDMLMSINHEKKTQAFYIAQSGAEAMGKYIVNYSYDIDNSDSQVTSLVSSLNNKTSQNSVFEDIKDGKGSFIVNVKYRTAGGLKYVDIASTAEYLGVGQSIILTLEGKKQFTGQNGAMNIYPDGTFAGNGTPDITGDVYYYGIIGNAVSDDDGLGLVNNSVAGDIYILEELYEQLNENQKNSIIEHLKNNTFELKTFNLPPPDSTNKFPFDIYAGLASATPLAAPTDGSTLFDGEYYEYANLNSGTLNIDVSNSDVNVYFAGDFKVKDLNVNRSSGGEGIINIYADTIDITNFSQSALPREKLTNIYVKGSTATINSNGVINANLIVNTADILIPANTQLNGDIISWGDKVTLQGSPTADPHILFAPLATVKMGGGGIIRGPVYGLSFDAGGSTAVYYPNEDANGDLVDDLLGKLIYKYFNWE